MKTVEKRNGQITQMTDSGIIISFDNENGFLPFTECKSYNVDYKQWKTGDTISIVVTKRSIQGMRLLSLLYKTKHGNIIYSDHIEILINANRKVNNSNNNNKKILMFEPRPKAKVKRKITAWSFPMEPIDVMYELLITHPYIFYALVNFCAGKKEYMTQEICSFLQEYGIMDSYMHVAPAFYFCIQGAFRRNKPTQQSPD